MTKEHYVDHRGLEIEKNTFYFNSRTYEVLFVYGVQENGIPSTQNPLHCFHPESPTETMKWIPISDPKEYMSMQREELKWMKNTLSKLEQEASSLSLPKSTEQYATPTQAVKALRREMGEEPGLDFFDD